MNLVNTTRAITAQSVSDTIDRLLESYPSFRSETLGTTAFQRPIRTLVVGNGPKKLLYTAAHHANEWITALILLKFAEDFGDALSVDGQLGGINARKLNEEVTIYMVPLVNPDGVDLVNGAIQVGDIQFDLAKRISQDYPSIPFPDGWKANLLGTDLNLNYPAGWLQAREIKFSQGFVSPAPRDYVGRAPFNQLETQMLSGYTEAVDPVLVLAYHTQGQEIYWQFGDIQVPGAEELGQELARVSGYQLAQVPYNSAFAGYKDWFIQEFRRPGYTIEAGLGINPLPLSQFEEIYADNLPLMNIAALGISSMPA
jgi:g-D-glutamyl-meso-diaminopimelate peptidase